MQWAVDEERAAREVGALVRRWFLESEPRWRC